jgi:hypothetical protein
MAIDFWVKSKEKISDLSKNLLLTALNLCTEGSMVLLESQLLR